MQRAAERKAALSVVVAEAVASLNREVKKKPPASPFTGSPSVGGMNLIRRLP